MRSALTWALSLALATAAGAAWAADTYRFDRGVISVGDSTGALINKGGQPSRIVQLENRLGAAVGERWEYHLRGKTVSFEIHGGKVSRIDES
ncbi:MAG: hypothetical protein ACRC2X_15510 [Giesbergeria sp.]